MGMVRRIAEADVINLGSTYAHYDFSYGGLPVKGVNLAQMPQYLYMDLKFVNKYKKYFKDGKKVVIVLPNFVFAADAKARARENSIYYLKFSPRELEWFSVTGFVRAFVRRGTQWGRHRAKAALGRLTGDHAREMTHAEKEAAALARIQAWRTVLGIPSMTDANVPEAIRLHIRENIRLLDEIVREIRGAGGEPYIVVPPVSETMNRLVSRECMQAYLFDPIEAREDKTVPVFDYLYDSRYQAEELYWNADCLTPAGAAVFTRDVCGRLGLIGMEFHDESE